MGHVVDFYLSYAGKSSDEQARAILAEARTRLEAGAPGVAITYSANYGQTETIHRTYASGGWNTGTGGANQADVMRAMERLLGGEASDLQGRVRIAPITTIYSPTVAGLTHADVIATDLDRIEGLLEDGWDVLGWQNQDSAPGYAIGGKGGVAGAAYPPELSAVVQERLRALAAAYPPAG